MQCKEIGYRSNVFPSEIDPAVMKRLGENFQRMKALYGDFGFGAVHRMAEGKRGNSCEDWLFWGKLAREIHLTLVPCGLVDPAIVHAILRHTGLPMPNGRSFSKEEGENTSKEWNSYVDHYIAQGTDPREPIEIERAAKIGVSCGALYRTCQGANCQKLEGRDVTKLLLCSKCKMSVYCSRNCQASDWKTHKLICSQTGPHGQPEQMLPSQAAIQKYIMPNMFKGLVEDMDLILGNTYPVALRL
ncbi:hypothetical protein GLOTRDRAFT_128077 [Gloeophyllum trabeum ATCC 11539]|uniref:MYND-type domain-containing protein n=1 Tax=Gloeophyllum trabeum (strain ATCC 11539 / FP-39264 / Madison 617) TaxID=670483 RepID=S7RNP2_GLOTA|nr:uncharacterized protein GLOTRDRAFT_128077 [Gloeophyllum trabeum ATCC 11539]EPQ56120.1 hypothetical protein GLOTRDRAFT_128077 [Gloeophyllum trabeum ATCC 11539]